jgi:hypothetical protein
MFVFLRLGLSLFFRNGPSITVVKLRHYAEPGAASELDRDFGNDQDRIFVEEV